jgi:hypothetical protein
VPRGRLRRDDGIHCVNGLVLVVWSFRLLDPTSHVVRLVADVGPDWGVQELARWEAGSDFLKGGVNPLVNTDLIAPESAEVPPTL